MVTVNKYLPATCPQVADYLSTNYIFRLNFSNFYLLFSKHLKDASQKTPCKPDHGTICWIKVLKKQHLINFFIKPNILMKSGR